MHSLNDNNDVKHDIRSSGEMAEWSIAAVLKTVEVRASGGSNPSLSAINLENQGFAKFVHENVHETPDFNTISGVFYCIFPTDVHERSPAQNRASTLFPGATPGLSQQCGCKVMNLLQNLHDSLKNLFYPIDEWRSFQVKQHRDTKQCNIKDVSPTVRVGRWFLLFVA